MPDKLARMQVELDVESQGLSQGIDQATAELDQFEQSLTGLNTQALDAMLATLDMQFKAMETDLAKLDASIENTQNKMMAKGALPSTINEDPGILKMQQSAMNLQTALDMVKAKIGSVKTAIATINNKPITKLKTAFQDVGTKAEEAGAKSERSMKKSMKTIAKVGALLLGVRTAYSIVTRAVRAYLDQNKGLQTQINSMYMALGSLLAPAIEGAVKWMVSLTKWVIVAAAYTAKFLNVIFGFNIGIKKSVANTNNLNKSLKGTSKAMSNLAGFDDLTILQDPTSAGAAAPETPTADLSPYDMTSQLAGLDAFGQKLKELQPILLPVTVLIGLLGLAILACLSPITGIVIGIGILIGIIVLVISKWDTLNGVQKALIIGLGLIVAGILAWIAVQAIINALMFANPIGLIILAIAALVAIIALVIIYWNDIIKVIGDFVSKAWTWISTFCSNIGKVFANIGSAIWNSLVSAFEGIKKAVGKVWDWILNLFSKGGSIFSGVVDGVAGVFKTVVNTLISGINFIIAAPFKIINGLLNTIRNISIMGMKPFAGLWDQNPLPVPQIPKLATGGVASGPTVAQIGEGRYSEAVVPLGQSPQFAEMKRDIADDVVNRLSGSGGNVEVIFQVDSDTWGRASIKGINKVQRQAGKTLIKI